MQICDPFQDLQEFLDGAEHGAVLFTMGFVFETSFVPRERIDALFSVFARLPQRVVMRLDKGGKSLSSANLELSLLNLI